MTLALNLAQAVNCPGEKPPCGECRSCQRIAASKHADVWTIRKTSEGKTEIGIDQIREVRTAASLPPYEGKCKVFIIDRAEHLSLEAANCLLKTLEEPPPQVLFVLLTAAASLLLPTILSRCQRVELRPLPVPAAEQALLEMKGITSTQAGLLARLSGGCLGWAIRAIEEEGLVPERKEKLATLVSLGTGSKLQRLDLAAQLAAQFSKKREEVAQMLDLWLGWWQDLLLVKAGCQELVTNLDQTSLLREQAEVYHLRQITDFIHCLQAAQEQLKQNANPRLVLEVLMLSLPQVEAGTAIK